MLPKCYLLQEYIHKGQIVASGKSGLRGSLLLRQPSAPYGMYRFECSVLEVGFDPYSADPGQ